MTMTNDEKAWAMAWFSSLDDFLDATRKIPAIRLRVMDCELKVIANDGKISAMTFTRGTGNKSYAACLHRHMMYFAEIPPSDHNQSFLSLSDVLQIHAVFS